MRHEGPHVERLPPCRMARYEKPGSVRYCVKLYAHEGDHDFSGPIVPVDPPGGPLREPCNAWRGSGPAERAFSDALCWHCGRTLTAHLLRDRERSGAAAKQREWKQEFGPASDAPPSSVDHPKHYTSHPSGVECITVVEHMGFNLGNAIKYIWRADEKGNALEDLQKAAWYVNREIERRKNAQP